MIYYDSCWLFPSRNVSRSVPVVYSILKSSEYFEDLNGIPSVVFYITTSLSKLRKLPTTSVHDVNVDAVKGMRFLNQVSAKTINCLPYLTFPDPKSPDITSSSSAPASSLSKSSTSTSPDISSISSYNTSYRVGQYCIDLSRQQCHVISKAITLAKGR